MKQHAIDETTPVPIRLGIVILLTTTCLGLIGGTIGAVWWWASWSSRIDTKLTSIETSLALSFQNHTRNSERLDEIERRVVKIEVAGSPPVQQMQKDVAELLRQFESHRAREIKP